MANSDAAPNRKDEASSDECSSDESDTDESRRKQLEHHQKRKRATGQQPAPQPEPEPRPTSPSLANHPLPEGSAPSIFRHAPVPSRSRSRDDKKRAQIESSEPTQRKAGRIKTTNLETCTAFAPSIPIPATSGGITGPEDPLLGPSENSFQLALVAMEEKVDLLSVHVRRCSEYLETAIAQNQKLTDTVTHLCKELAKAHSQPNFCAIPNSPAFDDLAHQPPPIPDPNENAPRPMQMREREQLARAIRLCGSDARCKGLIRIAEPDALPKQMVNIRISEYEPKKLWKLWHYVVCGKELKDVLTAEERAASDPKRFFNSGPGSEDAQRPLLGETEQNERYLETHLTALRLQQEQNARDARARG